MAQWLLFTWSRCSQCARLKPYLQRYINAGIVREYDLDQIRGNQQLMRIFMTVSRSGHVPALVLVDRDHIGAQAVGVSPIMTMLGIN